MAEQSLDRFYADHRRRFVTDVLMDADSIDDVDGALAFTLSLFEQRKAEERPQILVAIRRMLIDLSLELNRPPS